MADRPSDLKPCPFCGCADIARANNTYGAHWTMCNGCGTQTGEVGISSQAEADARWNTRAAPAPTAEHWRMAIKERGIENPKALDWIEQRARELAQEGE